MTSISDIQQVVSERTGISVEDMLSHKRNYSIVRARHIAMAITRNITRKSYPEIAMAFNRRDHTTVMHACKKVRNYRRIAIDFDMKIKQWQDALKP